MTARHDHPFGGQHGLDYTTTCPVEASGQHRWYLDGASSGRTVQRFSCDCGARGWRSSDGVAKQGEIRQYAPNSDSDKAAQREWAKGAPPPPPATPSVRVEAGAPAATAERFLGRPLTEAEATLRGQGRCVVCGQRVHANRRGLVPFECLDCWRERNRAPNTGGTHESPFDRNAPALAFHREAARRLGYGSGASGAEMRDDGDDRGSNDR